MRHSKPHIVSSFNTARLSRRSFLSVGFLDLIVEHWINVLLQQWVSVSSLFQFRDQWASFLCDLNLERLTSYQAHRSDLLNVYGGGELVDYIINFVTNLDPNGKTQLYWPKYTNKRPKLLTFLDGSTPVEVSEDTFRWEVIKFIGDVVGSNPIWVDFVFMKWFSIFKYLQTIDLCFK